MIKTQLPEKSKSHEAVIHEIRDIIVENYVDKIAFVILFGSFARGDWVHDYYKEDGHDLEYASDYDFLVITKKTKNGNGAAGTNLKNDINKKLKEFKRPYKSHTPTIIIEPLLRVNEELEKGRYFFTDIKKEGVCLYSSGEFELVEPKELDEVEVKKIAKEDFEQWFESGEGFLRLCHDAIGHDNYKRAAFLLHQATEAFLTCSLLVTTGYRPKTHNIEELLSLCSSQSNKFLNIFPQGGSSLEKKITPHRTIPADQIEILYNSKSKADWFELLKIAYIESRYSKYYKIKKEQLDYLIERVEYLREVDKEVCLGRL